MVVAAAVVAAGALYVLRGKPDYQATLAGPDPCAVRAVEKAVLDNGSPAERELLKKRLGECSASSAPSLCEGVAADVSEGRVDEERAARLSAEPARGAASAALYRALAQKRPRIDDLVLTPDEVPCTSQLWPKVVQGLADSAEVWALALKVSLPMKEAIKARGLGPGAREALVRHTTITARLRQSGNAAAGPQAEALCALVEYFAAGEIPECKGAAPSVSATVDAGPAEDPYAGIPPKFAAAAKERNRQIAALNDCVQECGFNRNADERTADLERAKAANEITRQCQKKCGSDMSCLTPCLKTIPKSGAMECQAACEKKYPEGKLPEPRL